MNTDDRATRKRRTPLVASRRGVRTLLFGLLLTSLIASVAHALSKGPHPAFTEPARAGGALATQREDAEPGTWIGMLDSIRGSDLWAPIYASGEVTRRNPIDGATIDFDASGTDEGKSIENPEPNVGLLTGLGLLGLAARRYRRR